MSTRPNVLFMIADDHRHDLMGVAGARQVRTPVMDALAARGMHYRRAHCQGGMTGAICAPSRAILMTGVDLFEATASSTPGDPGVYEIEESLPTMPEVFGAAGYHTFATGKWHNGARSLARSFGDGAKLFVGAMSDHDKVPVHDFDPTGAYAPEDAYLADGFSSDVFADAAISFLSSQEAAQDPFFCYVAFTAPHDPRTPPGAYATMYEPGDIELPPNFLPQHPFDNGDLRVRDELLAGWPRTDAEIRQHLADYYGMISHLDYSIGRILEALERTGLADNTIVVYTGDHGLAVGQHGLMGKQNLYDHSLRVPLIMAGPGVPVGETFEGVVNHADTFPGLARLAGVPVPSTVQGGPGRTHTFAAYLDVQRMVSNGRHKLIRYYVNGSERVQLFDLEHDPWELDDRSADPAFVGIRGSLEATLAAWQRDQGDPLAPNTT